MAYSEELEFLLDRALSGVDCVEKKRMFGGLAYMVCGHMCVGVIEDKLMARVGPAAYENCLKSDFVHEMDFTGKPLRGIVYVDSRGFATNEELCEWVNKCQDFVRTLPAKQLKA